jgi:hypothetical protein
MAMPGTPDATAVSAGDDPPEAKRRRLPALSFSLWQTQNTSPSYEKALKHGISGGRSTLMLFQT